MKNNVKFRVNIQSYSDVITNSSSELFLVRNTDVIDDAFLKSIEDELYKYADEHDKDCYSGMGGEIEVKWGSDWLETHKTNKYNFYISVDNALYNTIEYIKNTFNGERYD